MPLDAAQLAKIQNRHILATARSREPIYKLSVVRQVAKLMAIHGLAQGIPITMLRPGRFLDFLTHEHAGEYGSEYWSQLRNQHKEYLDQGNSDVEKVLQLHSIGHTSREMTLESKVPESQVLEIIGYLEPEPE